MNHYKDKIVHLAELCNGRIYLKTFSSSNDECKNFLRRIRDHRNFYYAFRTSDKTYVFHTDNFEDGLKLITEEVIALDWKTITNTSVGTHISSNIHTLKIQMDKDNLQKIKIPNTLVDASMDKVVEMKRQARIECSDLDPHTNEEAEIALRILNKKFIEIVERNGYRVIANLFKPIWVDKRKQITWEPIETVGVTVKSRKNYLEKLQNDYIPC